MPLLSAAKSDKRWYQDGDFRGSLRNHKRHYSLPNPPACPQEARCLSANPVLNPLISNPGILLSDLACHSFLASVYRQRRRLFISLSSVLALWLFAIIAKSESRYLLVFLHIPSRFRTTRPEICRISFYDNNRHFPCSQPSTTSGYALHTNGIADSMIVGGRAGLL
jgi:hypothetical protein